MFKKEVLLVILLISIAISSYLVSAVIEDLEASEISTEEFFLDKEVPLMINGKTITLLDQGVNEAYVTVDGVRGTIFLEDFKYINGVSIKLIAMWDKNQYRNLSVDVNITTYGSCGDGICNDREVCCKDCGCGTGDICIDNQCILNTSNKCSADLNCLDQDVCTSDTCAGVPRKCLHTPIVVCRSGDGCCAGGCTIQNDRDCAQLNIECYKDEDCNNSKKCSSITHLCYGGDEETSTETAPHTETRFCVDDKDCEDNNQCTKDMCRYGECTYGKIEECAPKEASITIPAPQPTSTKDSYLWKNKGPLAILSIEFLLIIFLLLGWDYFF
jgi:hypothetical protein